MPQISRSQPHTNSLQTMMRRFGSSLFNAVQPTSAATALPSTLSRLLFTAQRPAAAALQNTLLLQNARQRFSLPMTNSALLLARRSFADNATSTSAAAATTSQSTSSSAAVVQPQKIIFAVVHIAGHQYKVSPGDLLSCQRIDGDIGDTIKLDKVLMVGDATFTKLGMPLVAGSYVSAVIEEQTLADKIIVFKKRRRKGYERTRGHRQRVTTIRIVDVVHE